MDFFRSVKKRCVRRSQTNDDKLRELAKFIQNRYSYQEGLIDVSQQSTKVVVEVDEESKHLHQLKTLNPKLVEVRTSCRSSRVSSRRPSFDRS